MSAYSPGLVYRGLKLAMADDLHAAVGFVLKHLISKRRNRVSKALDTAQENNNAMGATDALTKDCH